MTAVSAAVAARGHVYWENETYTDPRVLLHIPKGFDIRKPAVMVVFFHGHGAKIDRDVRDRQQDRGADHALGFQCGDRGAAIRGRCRGSRHRAHSGSQASSTNS